MCLVQKPRGVIHGITYSLRVANLGIVFLTAKVWLLISLLWAYLTRVCPVRVQCITP